VADFVLREWSLAPYPGDQAPLHIHYRGDEAFYVLDGLLEVQDGDERLQLRAGQFHVVSAGSPHTFATVAQVPARVLVVMTPEIDRLIERLHAGGMADLATVWAEHHSSVVGH
jgi:mannose-6-phosphate isomerase-like protein (cupin superfamily)